MDVVRCNAVEGPHFSEEKQIPAEECNQPTQSYIQEDCETDDSTFTCNICLEPPNDAIVSYCGHLYCWQCLYTWMQVKAERPLCPVCKSAISANKVIPIYGPSGAQSAHSPKSPQSPKFPPRPKALREDGVERAAAVPQWFADADESSSFPEDANILSFHTSFFNANIQLRFGVGRLPGLPTGVQLDDQARRDVVSNILLGIGFALLVWLLFI